MMMLRLGLGEICVGMTNKSNGNEERRRRRRRGETDETREYTDNQEEVDREDGLYAVVWSYVGWLVDCLCPLD